DGVPSHTRVDDSKPVDGTISGQTGMGDKGGKPARGGTKKAIVETESTEIPPLEAPQNSATSPPDQGPAKPEAGASKPAQPAKGAKNKEKKKEQTGTSGSAESGSEKESPHIGIPPLPIPPLVGPQKAAGAPATSPAAGASAGVSKAPGNMTGISADSSVY